jgi:hypothetical protein
MTKTSWKLIGLVLVATALLVLAGCTNAGAGGDGGGAGPVSEQEAAEAYAAAFGALGSAAASAEAGLSSDSDSGTATSPSCTVDWTLVSGTTSGSTLVPNRDYEWTLELINCADPGGSGITINGTASFAYDDTDDNSETEGGTFTYDASFSLTGAEVSTLDMSFSASFDGTDFLAYTGTITVDGDTINIQDVVS